MREMYAFDSKPSLKLWEALDLVEKLKDEESRLSEYELEYLKSLDNYDSVHIEGNSLTRAEVTSFLETGITVHGKPFKDFLECKNYSKALELLKVNVNEQFTLTTMFVRNLHKLLMNGILEDEFVGNYRKEQVVIRGATYLPPWWVDVPELLTEVIDNYNNWDKESETRFENIIRVMYQFEGIHPFIDGNGRTGRVLMNYLLLANGYPFIWVNSVYRTEYLECFSDWESCLGFHTNRILTMYKTIADVRTGKLESLEDI